MHPAAPTNHRGTTVERTDDAGRRLKTWCRHGILDS
jgi:hypothetical protein